MNTNLIVIKTQPATKAKAKQIASEFGLTLSGLINMLLKQVIRDKAVTLSLEEKPSQYMIDALKKSEEDVRAGRVITFKNAQEEFDYLDKEIANEKRKQSSH